MRVDVFLSYTGETVDIAREIAAYLRQNSINAWLAADHVAPGDNWSARVSTQIETADAIVIILSKDYMRSHWARTEAAFATARTIQESGPVVIPVFTDDSEIPPLLAYIQGVEYVRGADNHLALERIVSAVRRKPLHGTKIDLDNQIRAIDANRRLLNAEEVDWYRRRQTRSRQTLTFLVLFLVPVVILGILSILVFLLRSWHGSSAAGVAIGVLATILVETIALSFRSLRRGPSSSTDHEGPAHD
ncbi:toll/interleukin-1 receptor domain-containing protein [Frankia sp. AgB1.9]|uniref:toll/interleukin-1 receptor domain-containing protein n=1 Tax=unclassified Frankia TaxID=2632575 RepID=UPI001932DE98|nr:MULTISPECIES: toll/interleukin-1 receptor domain-containing protein [unclassified Frankia]MBL7487624.1 toll/interleukin-1 receptor domain-containing protein [Frankia sp. AgW1.1]MBL7548910.1 toll/interleukin-1 receptor domain-containing protein [Frankia sp. AgB1.9]MBL7624878.1 toll/interleukin-1 receptor domain-containing protein [Frankia sp. AgB1.8]